MKTKKELKTEIAKERTRERAVPDEHIDRATEDRGIAAENPFAIYDSPEAHRPGISALDNIRHLAHRHKKVLYLILISSILLSILQPLGPRSMASAEGILIAYFDRSKGDSGDWVYEISSEPTSEEVHRSLFQALGEFTWGGLGFKEISKSEESFQLYVADQMATDVLVRAAMQEGLLNDPKNKLIIENAVRKAVADIYLFAKIDGTHRDFRPKVDAGEIRAALQTINNLELLNKADLNEKRVWVEYMLNLQKRERISGVIAEERRQIVSQLRGSMGYRVRSSKIDQPE